MPPRTGRITRLQLYHYFCQSVPFSGGAQHALDALQKQGGSFFWAGQTVTKVAPILDAHGAIRNQPGCVVGEDGSIIGGLEFSHRLLVPEREGTLGELMPKANFGFFAGAAAITFSQTADFVNSAPADALATGLLAMACHLYPHFRPKYGWVDEYGWNLPEGKALASPNPRFLFWANFFGPEIVKGVGLDFLKGAPGWSVVDLEDGGLLYVANESYESWWHDDQTVVLDYFRQRFPKIQIYRAQPIPY